MTAKKSFEKVLLEELAPFAQGRIMKDSAEETSLPDLAASYAATNMLKNAAEARLKELKPFLHLMAEARGLRTEKGGFELDVGSAKIFRERREASEPDHDKLRALLETHSIGIFDAFDEIKTVQLNPSKLQYLIEVGKLTKKEVDAICNVSYAMRVVPSKELKEQVTALLGDNPEEEERPRGRGKARK